MKIKLFGNKQKSEVKGQEIDPASVYADMTSQGENQYVSPVNEAFISKLNDTLKKYTQGKHALENKIIENDRWYKSQHWDIIRRKDKDSDKEPEPVSAYLFNTLANKHADAMDYYPEPNILEREDDDVEEAENLSEVIPLVLDQNDFRATYSIAWWYKLKQGCVPYGVFWNTEKENGLGDIDLQKLDLLNIYWQPGISDIQKSPYLFIVSLVDDDLLQSQYPQLEGRLGQRVLDYKLYVTDDTIDITGKSLVVDAYYKRYNSEGKQILHMTKFVDSIPLGSTEDDPQDAEEGLYDHGMYPVIFDVLFPEENSPAGFGFVDICKNPQMYIDKLDQIISRNAVIAGKYRMLVKENGAINEEELADLSKDIIHTKGGVTEGVDYALLQGKPLPAFIVNHRENKISELKEVSGANDFNRGEGSGGVTAASAILALQEAGNKLSRDMIGDSYAVYTKIVYMCIELIRQFYDEPRKFRSEDTQGNAKYIPYSNKNLKPIPLPVDYEGEEPKHRKPIFDIKVKPEKASPFSKAAQNELGKEMFSLGFFNPQRAVEAKIALGMMSFEGKDKVLKQVSENGDLFMQIQQLQQMVTQQQSLMAGMNEVIKKTTGKDMMAGIMPGAEGGMVQNG